MTPQCRFCVAKNLVLQKRIDEPDVRMLLKMPQVMHVEQLRLNIIASAGSRHLRTILPAGLGRQQSLVQRGIELGRLFQIQHLTAFDVQLAGDLQSVEVAFAVTHDLVGPVAVLVGMCGLPITRMNVLCVPACGPTKGKVVLKDFTSIANRTAF